ncbi:sensor histidine kinase [Longispora sp. K20-0274]|uniref:anti-sigma factor RsbA family regulatory protein n=1 Tax=Longispora sp. K20-0274 TaxID=3088255 RepID=UPI00399B241E
MTQSRGHFEHPGLLYASTAEYVAATTEYIGAGLDAGESVLVAVPGARLTLIRDALGPDASAVRWADMAVAGRNPGRIIPDVLLRFAGEHAGKRVRIVGEPIWPERTAVEYPACAQHEALINVAFAGRDATILCPYDIVGLDPGRVADAARTHPVLSSAATTWTSTAYGDPVATAAHFNQPLPPEPPGAASAAIDGAGSLIGLRGFLTAEGRRADLSHDQLGNLLIAVNELATNTCEHAAGTGRVTVWTEPGRLVCQVTDTGHITDPLAGRVPPPTDATGGRGLILAHQLCDLIRIHTGPTGTTIRLHLGL